MTAGKPIRKRQDGCWKITEYKNRLYLFNYLVTEQMETAMENFKPSAMSILHSHNYTFKNNF